MTTQCIYIKSDGFQCKLRTSRTICHIHINLYNLQLEKEKHEAEIKRVNEELAKLRLYEKNVKNEITQLIEKRSKINTLKDELDSFKEEVKSLEKSNEELEKQNEELQQINEMLIREKTQIEYENHELRKQSKKWDIVHKFEKMKNQLIELTNHKLQTKFDIDEVAFKDEYKDKLIKLFGCDRNELKKKYKNLQHLRNLYCHPYSNANY